MFQLWGFVLLFIVAAPSVISFINTVPSAALIHSLTSHKMCQRLNNNSFKEGQLPVKSGFYLSTRTIGVIYFPRTDSKEMHSEPRQHGWNNA